MKSNQIAFNKLKVFFFFLDFEFQLVYMDF